MRIAFFIFSFSLLRSLNRSNIHGEGSLVEGAYASPSTAVSAADENVARALALSVPIVIDTVASVNGERKVDAD
jgi:hypothetical protein